VLNIVRLLRCTIFFGPMSGSGQKETKNQVRCHGSFRRKRPWRPLGNMRANGVRSLDVSIPVVPDFAPGRDGARRREVSGASVLTRSNATPTAIGYPVSTSGDDECDIAGLGSAAAWPVVARAQQPNRMRRVSVHDHDLH
jgi:hypothetical protein